jgi:predicted Zn-dependent peptidase
MYEDNPDSRVYYELMKCLYKNDGIRYDVGGDTDSISNITPELLYFCHRTFYSPGNMTLVISGNVDVDRIISVMDENVPLIPSPGVQKLYPDEPEKAYRKQRVIRMDISEPLFSFGIKDRKPTDPKSMRRRSVALSVLCNMLFGASSSFYCDCYEKGLLSGDIDAGYYYCENNAYLSVTGESRRPFTVKRRIKETIERALTSGIDCDEFERTKKVFYANFIYSMQNSSSIAYSLLSFEQLHDDMLAYPQLLSETNGEEALCCMRELYDKDRCAFAAAVPYKEENNVSRDVQGA